MPKPRILLTVMTWAETSDDDFCRPFLDLLFGTPELAPEKVENFEPVTNAVASAEDALPYCREDPFLWVRKRAISSTGGFYHAYGDVAGTFTLDAAYDSGFDWLGLLRNLVRTTRADYGYLHLVSDFERNASHLDPRHAQDFYYLGALSKTLEGGFLELAWANYFGPRWAATMDATKLVALGAHLEPLEDGQLLVVTGELGDVTTNFEAFAQRRDILRSTFDESFFVTAPGKHES